METLYIDKKSCSITKVSKHLVIKPKEGTSTSIPFDNIKRIVIACDMNLATNMLRQLAKHNIELVILDFRDYAATCLFSPTWRGNALIKNKQYQIANQSDLALPLICYLLKRKFKTQVSSLLTLQRKYPQMAKANLLHFKEQASQQTKILSHQADLSYQCCLGIEGSSARRYFKVIADILPDSLNFKGRNKRPPKDPCNSLMSLTYTLLYKEASKALFAAGLDPCIGFYHQATYNRQSLACDLVELFRAKADLWLVSLLKEQNLRLEHFSYEADGACYFSKTGRLIYFPAYEKQAKKWRKLLKVYASALSHYIQAERG